MEVGSKNTSSPAPSAGMPSVELFIVNATTKDLRFIVKRSGSSEPFNREKITRMLARVCSGFNCEELIDRIYHNVYSLLFEGTSTDYIEKCCILAAVSLIERDPSYDTIATRLLLQQITREVGVPTKYVADYAVAYRAAFIQAITEGVAHGLLDARLLQYPLETLAQALQPQRDELLGYMGLHTLQQRYFLRYEGLCKELPQLFWMRVAMGLALHEVDATKKVLEFYDIMSTLRYVPSTPSLFHSGFPVAQLSSCYLNTVEDDLGHIFKCIGDNAQLAKWAGGIGIDCSNIRGTGAYIRSIKATSQGVIPYLKIINDVVVAITRTGIRRGGTCAYLEVFHVDIEDFLDLRRNTGDERRRAHDMNTAVWVPDLFMKRLMLDADWTLFSPEEVPDLHHIYGAVFEKRYEHYEAAARAGAIKNYRVISAKMLWRKILTRIFETGHPWITFKDPCNIRSPQDHVGVVHSSNLCTEITLNTSATETAVCNLGSINLGVHMREDGMLDFALLRQSVRAAIRMLDNVIDLNFYPTIEAQNANKRHRPIGLGLMGFQDALFKANIPFSSKEAYDFADISMEHISYYAIEASMELAREKGPYETFHQSKWDRGLFPLDTIDLLEQERGVPIEVSRAKRLDWDRLKAQVKRYGMRNSNTMAIAPTATIATIAGCYPSIEPIYRNIYVKSNVSGEFTVVNKYLIKDLQELRLWNSGMLDQLKYYDGDLENIASIPDVLKRKYQTAFELDPEWLIEITAVRGKWIDQSQSHNHFVRGVSGPKLSAIYEKSWRCGLKTNYYTRTLAATQVEKSTLDAKEFGFTQKRVYMQQGAGLGNGVIDGSATMSDGAEVAARGAQCALDAGCESCQ